MLSLFLVSAPWAHADGSDQYNFRFSPVTLLIGLVGVDLDIKVSDQWTVGPELAYWHFSLSETGDFTQSVDITAFAVGARANWFLNGTYTDGLYIGPSLKYVSVKATTANDVESLSGTASVLQASVLVGYGWFWPSFNMMLGGGLALPLGNQDVTVTDSNGDKVSENISSTGSLALEYSLGWTF
jgi:hypothetical protein